MGRIYKEQRRGRIESFYKEVWVRGLVSYEERVLGFREEGMWILQYFFCSAFYDFCSFEFCGG